MRGGNPSNPMCSGRENRSLNNSARACAPFSTRASWPLSARSSSIPKRLPKASLSTPRNSLHPNPKRARKCSRAEIARLAQLVLVHHSALHHECHFFEFRNVFQRIARNRHQIRPLSGLDGPHLVAPPKQLRRFAGSRADCLHRRHSVFHVVFELLRLIQISPIESSGVRSEHDFHALLQSLLERRLLQIHHFHPISSSPRRHVRAYRDGRHPVHAVPRHFVHLSFRQTVAVFDGVNACTQCGRDSIAPDRVRRHSLPQPVRFLDDRLCLVIREVHHAVQHTVLRKVISPVRVILDPVRSIHDLLAHRFPCRFHTVHVLHARRHP